MKTEKNHIQFKELYSDLSSTFKNNTNTNSVAINTYNHQPKFLLNMTFSNIEYQFKCNPEKIKALSNHNFDDIVDTTKKEIQNIFQHNGHSFEVTKEEASRIRVPLSVPVTTAVVAALLIVLPSLLSAAKYSIWGIDCSVAQEFHICQNNNN